MGPDIIKLTLDGPELLAQRNPVIGDVIAHVVFLLRHAKHGDFTFIPACNNIETEATSGNVINGCHLFCGADWVDCRHMKRGEYANFLCFRG